MVEHCKNCGTKLEADEKLCLNCAIHLKENDEAATAELNNKIRKTKMKLIGLVAAGFLLLLLLAVFGVYVTFRVNTNASLQQSQLHSDYVEHYNLIVNDEPIPKEIAVNEFSLARIVIPAINIDYIVIGGVDVYDPVYLERGPVHFQMTDFPGTEPGNVVIGGHRSNVFSPPVRFYDLLDVGLPMHFYDLDLLDVGDEIHLDIDGYRFTYTVEWQKIVDSYDWSVINVEVDYPALSLQTCEPKYSGPDGEKRLFIRSALDKVTRAPAPE